MYAPHVSLDQAGKSPPSPCPHVVLSQDCEACGESNSGLLILEKLVSKRPDHLLWWRPPFIWLVWEWKPGLWVWRESSLLHDQHQKRLLGVFLFWATCWGVGEMGHFALPNSSIFTWKERRKSLEFALYTHGHSGNWMKMYQLQSCAEAFCKSVLRTPECQRVVSPSFPRLISHLQRVFIALILLDPQCTHRRKNLSDVFGRSWTWTQVFWL